MIYLIYIILLCLQAGTEGEKRAMKFAIPRIWREPTDHSSNCYFCLVNPSKRRTGQERASHHVSRHSIFHRPGIHTALSFLFQTLRRGISSSSGESSKSDSEERYCRSRLQFSQMRLRRKSHTSPTRRISTI